MPPGTIEFVSPVLTKPVSLTGEACSLHCSHCNALYLKHMQPAHSFVPGRESSCLVSGGCDSSGRVPVAKNLLFLHNLRNVGLRINLHTGLIGSDEIAKIARLVDVVSFDMIGDDSTIKDVYRLERSMWDFINCYRKLRRAVKTVPHITVGLHWGEIVGEYTAMRALKHFGAEQLVFNVLIPTKGTEFANVQPPELFDVGKLFRKARLMFGKSRLCLGCMVPHGSYRAELHEIAVDAGFDVIVNPAASVKNYAVEKGLVPRESRECCAL